MLWNWLRRHPNLVDAAIALVLAAGYVARGVHAHRWAAGVPVAALQVAPLLVRRRYPRLVLAVVTAGFMLEAVAYSPLPPFALTVAVFTVAVALPRFSGAVVSGFAAAAVTFTVLALGDYHAALSYPVPLVAGWVLGDSLGTRKRYLDSLESRTRAEEQARIARELHDVIAHNVSVMVVQAAAANDVFDTRPDRAREALQAIEASGRKALGELRSLLGAIRDGTEYEPQPGLDRLDDLVAQVRTAGLPVTVTIDGTPRPLPAGVELSAYRIVQEALTNTLKHAHAGHADVALRYADGELSVDVHDDGVGHGNGGGAGRGLVGMRERVTAYGGSFEAGPAPSGGFAVAARFPL